jgi:hypothetical protein
MTVCTLNSYAFNKGKAYEVEYLQKIDLPLSVRVSLFINSRQE